MRAIFEIEAADGANPAVEVELDVGYIDGLLSGIATDIINRSINSIIEFNRAHKKTVYQRPAVAITFITNLIRGYAAIELPDFKERANKDIFRPDGGEFLTKQSAEFVAGFEDVENKFNNCLDKICLFLKNPEVLEESDVEPIARVLNPLKKQSRSGVIPSPIYNTLYLTSKNPQQK